MKHVTHAPRGARPAEPASAGRGTGVPGATPPGGPVPGALAAPSPEWPDLAALATCVAAWLAIALFAHPIGDPYSESDFYGGYAEGARALLAGRLDPGRYGIVGPLYEVLLAAGGAIGLDLFLAAKLISVASAGAALAAWWAIAAAALGRGAARWAIAILALTPAFTRHAYSAGTDLLAVGLGSASLAVLVRVPRLQGAGLAGLLAALATLTRYQALALLPVALAAIAGSARRARLAPATGASPMFPPAAPRAAAFALGFAVIASPWLIFSLSRGEVPARALIDYYSFYAAEDAGRNLQDVGASAAASEDRSLARILRERPLELAARWGTRAYLHLARDARDLVGPGVALAAGLGALLWSVTRFGRHRGWLVFTGLAFHLSLVPAFYSERYRLLLIPLYATAAAALWPGLAGRARFGPQLAAVLLLSALVPLAARSVALQARVARELPRDVLNVAPRLASEPPGSVMARKGHLGYYAGHAVVAFPRVAEVSELAAAARDSRVRYLYYSWYEARLRPEWLVLLDTTRTLPGLERVAVSPFPAAVLYRVTPGFGSEGWLADPRERAVSEARAAVWTLGDSAAARGHALLAADAWLKGDVGLARRHARAALAISPGQKLARQVDSLAGAKRSAIRIDDRGGPALAGAGR